MYISPYVVGLGVSAAITGGVWAMTWRRRDAFGVRALRIVLLSITTWTVGYAAALSVQGQQLHMLFERVALTGGVVVPVAWVVFVLQYTGYSEDLTWRGVAVLSLPSLAMAALVWTNQFHGLIWPEPSLNTVQGITLITPQFGIGFWLYLFYAYAIVAAGMVLLLRLVFTADHQYAEQAITLLVGALVPLGAHILYMFQATPLSGLDLTPYAFVATGVAFGSVLFYSDLPEHVPATRHIGRNAVVQHLRDGVIVMDDDDVVVDINPVAERQFDCDADEVVGKPVESVFDDEFELPEEEDTTVWRARDPLAFEINVSELTNARDSPVGRVLSVRNITDRTNRQQQLQVLNRVLRHNFRNDMNVIDVCATQLHNRLTEEEAELADRIRMVARDLTETGTKAREIERIMSRRHNDPQPIDLPSLVGRQVDTIRHEYPEVDVETDLPDRLEITSTGILESALQNVLENAVIHNDSDDPEIEVTVETFSAAGEIEISVADNGPGIPSQERDVLLKGTETPLEHGSGLGLWLVNWGVTMLGGDVSFEDNDPRGSVVTLRVPRRPSIVTQSPSQQPPMDAN